MIAQEQTPPGLWREGSGKALGAKSLDNAIEIQSEYAKSAYEGFLAQATKLGEFYTHLAKEAFKPVETVFAKAQAVASPQPSVASPKPSKAP